MAKGRKEEVAKLDDLEKSGILFYSPSRRTNTRKWDCYDDIFIVDIAARKQGIVVSNDNYRDVLKLRNEEFNEQIKNRYIQIVVSLIRFYICTYYYQNSWLHAVRRHVHPTPRSSRQDRTKT